jgi:hypothetical protein
MTGEQTTGQTTSGKVELSEERQWELAMASLRRADEAANYLRTLLFVAASGFIILLMLELKAGISVSIFVTRICAIFAAGLVIALLVWSWQLQKRKSRDKFAYLRDGHYEAYRQYDTAVENYAGKRNSTIDRFAFVFLLIAFAIELYARYQTISAVVPAPVVPGVHV